MKGELGKQEGGCAGVSRKVMESGRHMQTEERRFRKKSSKTEERRLGKRGNMLKGRGAAG